MTKPFIAIVLVALPAAALAGQAPPPDGIRVTTTGAAREITGRVLDSLAVDTVIASFHERPPATYVGVGVDRLLAYAGVIVAGSRGRDFEQVVVVEAHDGYRMTFGVGEIDPSITGRRIVLTRATGEGEGRGGSSSRATGAAPAGSGRFRASAWCGFRAEESRVGRP